MTILRSSKHSTSESFIASLFRHLVELAVRVVQDVHFALNIQVSLCAVEHLLRDQIAVDEKRQCLALRTQGHSVPPESRQSGFSGRLINA